MAHRDRLRIAFAAGKSYDGGLQPWDGPEAEPMLEPTVTCWSESDQWLADDMHMALQARLSARRVLANLQARAAAGRGPYAPRLIPTFGPEALGQVVCDVGHPVIGGVSVDTCGGIVKDVTASGREVRWVQSVPRVRVEMPNVVDVDAREV